MLESHSFSVELAVKIGLNKAIILSHLVFLQKNFTKEGEDWTKTKIRRTIKTMQDIYPYLTKKEIRGALDKMEDDGILLSEIDNQNKFDRTKSYVLGSEGVLVLGIDLGQFDLTKGQMPFDKRANVHLTKGQMLNDSSNNSKYDISENSETPHTYTNGFASPVVETPQPKKERAAAPRKIAAAAHTPKDVYEKLCETGPEYGQFFRDVWKIWEDYLEHRTEIKTKKYASAKSEALAVIALHKISGGNVGLCKKIVEQSRYKQWIGLMPLKEELNVEPPKPQQQSRIPTYGQ